MNNENQNKNDITENKVNLQWGQKEVLGVKMENLQMTTNIILREVRALQIQKGILENKERNTPHLYANAIIKDTRDFHNFCGDDEMHEKAEISRCKFLRQVAKHLLVYCNANESEET